MKIRAAAAQISPDLEAPDGTTNKVLETIDRAAAQGVQLIVFPETLLPYYPYFSFVKPPVATGADHLRLYERAPTVPGPVVQAIAERVRARGMVAVVGLNERDHGSLYNTQLIFDADGSLKLKRRKITPTYHERMIWGQGDASRSQGGGHCRGPRRRARLLGALQPARPLRPHDAARGNPLRVSSRAPWSGQIFADQIEATIRHHALESGCFVDQRDGLANG